MKEIFLTLMSSIVRFFGLRERYIFTRAGQLRLRYVVLFAAFLTAGFPVILSGVGHVSQFLNAGDGGVRLAKNDTSTIKTGLNAIPDDVVRQLQETPYGQLALASIAAGRAVPQPLDRIMEVQSGDSLGKIMERAGVGNTATNKMVAAMKPYFDPRGLKVGQKLYMHFKPAEEREGPSKFAEMKIKVSALKTLVVMRAGDDFKALMQEKDVQKQTRVKIAKIKNSIYGSAAKAGIPRTIVGNALGIYAWNVDFQRDIHPGDTLEVMYDSYETKDGYVAKTGNIKYAKLTLGGREIPLYRFEMAGGRIDYFDKTGRSIKRTLMKTPIDGAHRTSGFGMRRHPVLGYNKMHKGVDFAAPRGTPIYAAGNGVVVRAGWVRGYGKYIKIRHNSKLSTAYAHMSKLKARNGQRVKQGEVIGYVGTTGRSTGPHLHYEVLKNGRQVNPNSVNLPIGEELAGKDKKRFKELMRKIDAEFNEKKKDTRVAFLGFEFNKH